MIRQIAGVVLIALGLVSLLWGGITWTRDKTVLDIGPLHAQTEERRTIPVPPIVGGIVLAGGVVLLLARPRRRA